MTIVRNFFLCICACISLTFSSHLYAACSTYAGQASINEIYIGTFESDFIEIKLLDSSISNSEYNNWQVRVCADNGCDSYSISNFDRQSVWHYLEAPSFNSNRIDFKDGFDVHLTDGSGNTINYVSVEGFDDQEPDSQCSALDDEVNTGPSIRLIRRNPDGTGGFGSFNNGQSKDRVTLGDDNINPGESVQLFQFTHDGNGITCQSEPVSIVACSTAACTSTDTSVNTSIDLVVSNGDSITVDIVNGVGSTAFNYTDTSTPAILSSSADYLCTNTSLSNSLGQTDADCGLNFTDAGFVFSTIGNQIAGVGYNGITITAVEANETGACSALFTSPTQVGLAMRYVAPNTTTSNTYTIGGTSINKSTFAPSTYTNINLNFSASGVATLPENIYYDAGQISLYAYKLIPASGNQVEVDIAGNSNSFWVRPDRFVITSPLAGASGIHAAGDDFNYEVNAVNRQGTTTSNYRPSSNVQASAVRVMPTSNDATNGTFTFADSLGGQVVTTSESFSDVNFDFQDIGIATISTAAYSEVGSISFDVRDNNYAGLGLVVDADAIVLGRFTPKYFEQTVIEHGEITGQCGAWAYSGQLTGVGGNGAISYSVAPTLSIVAKNADGDTTLNYRNFGSGDNHSFLSNSSVAVISPTEDLASGAESTPLLLSGTLFEGMLTQKLDEFSAVVSGEFTYTFSTDDHYVYTRDLNAVVTPFNAQFDIAVDSITDSDGITATVFNNVELRGSTEIRFGRLLLENSYGPETSALAQVFKTQYLTNVATMAFTDNNEDSCSAILVDDANWAFTDNDTSGGLTASDIGKDGSDGTMLTGEFDGISLRSTNSEQGSVNVEYLTPDWLKFDWNGDGVYDNNANAVATFGRYRGNDRIIYWREVNN